MSGRNLAKTMIEIANNGEATVFSYRNPLEWKPDIHCRVLVHVFMNRSSQMHSGVRGWMIDVVLWGNPPIRS